MAIYHRKRFQDTGEACSDGRNAVAAAAYRSGTSSSYEEASRPDPLTTARRWGWSTLEILAPAANGTRSGSALRSGRCSGIKSRPCEHRKDAQVAREVEVGLPIELSKNEQVELLRDFVKREFVSRGMVADFSLHLDPTPKTRTRTSCSRRRDI